MYCRYCGQQLPDDSAFCSKCGKKLEDPVTEEPETSAPCETDKEADPEEPKDE